MKYSDISKIQAAESQLKTAIELFLNERDSISIHTLASAAQEILETIGKKQGHKSQRLKMLEQVKPEKRKETISKLSRQKNFFKHADRNPDDITTLNPEYTELIIWDAVRLYYFITKKKVPTFMIYDLWMYSKLPGLYNLPRDDEALYKKMIAEYGGNHQNKLHFLQMIVLFEKELKRNIIPEQNPLFYDNKEYLLKELKFDTDTKVWNCFYTLNNQNIDTPEETIILNFFIKNVWADDFTAEHVANLFIKTNKDVIGFPFTAPDGITGKPAFFIISLRKNLDGYYLDVSKITSIRDSVYSISFSKVVQIGDLDLKKNVDQIVLKNLASNSGIAEMVANIGIDESWADYLTTKGNNIVH